MCVFQMKRFYEQTENANKTTTTKIVIEIIFKENILSHLMTLPSGEYAADHKQKNDKIKLNRFRWYKGCSPASIAPCLVMVSHNFWEYKLGDVGGCRWVLSK